MVNLFDSMCFANPDRLAVVGAVTGLVDWAAVESAARRARAEES
jgi:hypothetical protein